VEREPVFIELRASQPDADLACDFAIANGIARDGLREQLAAGIVPPIVDLPDGMEVTFTAESWPAVRRYVSLESQCCPFLNLAARRTGDAVVLTVTGRAGARELIANIFKADECC
jgi:hypothetical protein